MPLIIVEWWDIIGHSEWYDVPNIEKMGPALCRTVAWQFSKDDKLLKLAGTKSYDEDTKHYQLGDINIIPIGCVKSIKQIKTSK